jgi:hypothetical protein
MVPPYCGANIVDYIFDNNFSEKINQPLSSEGVNKRKGNA